MTSEAPWMGTTPDPPRHDLAGGCTGMLNCPGPMHQSSCHRVRADVHADDRRRRCSNEGHDWEFLATAAGDLHRVTCANCARTYACIEE